MVVLMLVSLTPGVPEHKKYSLTWLVVKTPMPAQKMLHICLYGVLVLLLIWSFGDIQSHTNRYLVSYVIAVVFGAIMEWWQTKIPGRSGTFSDIALNAVGAGLGILVAIFLL